MKLVQSFWSLPCLMSGDNQELLGSWHSERAHAMSWALSYHSLRKQHPDLKICLYTDQVGKEWLVDKIGLDYDEVCLELDSLANQNPKLWALGKIKTYSLQNEAFLHVDGDVYIWEAFDNEMMAKPLIAQNLEIGHDVYQKCLRELQDKGIKINFESNAQGYAVNAGILGGQDVGFFRTFSKEVFQFIASTSHIVDDLSSLGYYNMFFEQYLFAQMAIKAHYELKTIGTVLPDNQGFLHNLTRFGLVPQMRKYIHMIGVSKSNSALNGHLESRLLQEFPICYRSLDSTYAQKHPTMPSTGVGSTNTSFVNSELELHRLGHHLKGLDSNAIEQILEENFDNECYNTLWDFYQIENLIKDFNQHPDTNARIDLDPLYSLSIDSFLTKRFELNQQQCQIIFLYGLFPTSLDIEQGCNLQREHSNIQKEVNERQKLFPYLFNRSGNGFKIIPLSNWFAIYLPLSETAMTGTQICSQFSIQAKTSDIDLKIGIYEFLSAQCFIYNRINLIQE